MTIFKLTSDGETFDTHVDGCHDDLVELLIEAMLDSVEVYEVVFQAIAELEFNDIRLN